MHLDKSLIGVASTLAQEQTMIGEDSMDMKEWRPLDYTSHTKTDADKGYEKLTEKLLVCCIEY